MFSLLREAPRYNLVNVSADEFRQFLRYIPSPLTSPDLFKSRESAVAILKLATLWRFDTVRDVAVGEVGKNDQPAFRVLMAVRIGAKELLPAALDELAAREETMEDGEILGRRLSAKVERYRQKCPESRGKGNVFTSPAEIRRAHMEVVFGSEFVSSRSVE